MRFFRQNILPVIAALLWGMAFSAQSECAQRGMGAFSFNFYRSLIGIVVLFFVAVLFAGGFGKLFKKVRQEGKYLLWGGLCCGTVLFLAANLQQLALKGAQSGKVSFITTLYIILVPVFGLFLKKKLSIGVWVSVALATVGMFLLCIHPEEGFAVSIYDLFALGNALMFAVHILVIDYFVRYVDGVHLSCAQFVTVSVLSACVALPTEPQSFTVIKDCFWLLMYMGVFSSGVAYTLQIIAQKDSNTTIVTLLLSLESVFGVLSGAVFLQEKLRPQEYIGCGIMFAAVILSELPLMEWAQRKVKNRGRQGDREALPDAKETDTACSLSQD